MDSIETIGFSLEVKEISLKYNRCHAAKNRPL